MNFENCEAFVVPFSVNESSAWKEVIQYLSGKEATPVEAVCKSNLLSIAKEYYPVERLEIGYTATWNAVSIFIERWTEPETRYQQEIHYFDRYGEEHKHPGFDYFDSKRGKWKSGSVHPLASRVKGYSGDAGTRPWTPKEVTVEVTEDIPYERETGRRRNSGEVGNTYIYYHDKEYPFPMLLDRVLRSDSGVKIPYSEEAIKDGEVIKQSKPFTESDYNSALSDAKSSAKKECIQQIPGQKYADFRMEFNSEDICQVWYYPVYHIIYEFMGQNYECFVAGHQKDSVVGKITPEDNGIESTKQEYDNRRSDLETQKKKSRLNYIKIYLGFPILVGIIRLSFLDKIFSALGRLGSLLDGITSIGIWAIFIYLLWNNHKKIKSTINKINMYDEAKKNLVPTRQAKKKAIADIMIDDNLSDSEKAARCETILKKGPDENGDF